MSNNMTDDEFDVLDELYFVQSYEGLKASLEMGDELLKQVLRSLLEKGWIKCLEEEDKEPAQGELAFEEKYNHYFYLATKAGLLTHNGR